MPATSSAVNHVFVDFENVHRIDLSHLGPKTIFVTVFLGMNQKKVSASDIEELLTHCASVQLVRLTSMGKDALDFTLSYYIGRAVVTDPTGYFHIVSHDTGYDPLIEHLRSRNIHIRRHEDCTTLTFTSPPKPASIPVAAPAPPEDLDTRALRELRKSAANRPKRKKTLASHLLNLTGKSSTAIEIEKLIQRLQSAGHLAIDAKEKVTYSL